MANYAFTTGKELPQVQDGHVFERTNFSQKYPHTKIFEGINSLKFASCNLINCDVPVNAELINCNTSQTNRCSNLHPDFNIHPPCAENCSHVVDIDTIKIDGKIIDTICHYKDTKVS